MKILLISDNESFAKEIAEKIVFLRNDDKIIFTSYETALRELINADLIIIHEAQKYYKTIELVKDIRKISDLQILFISDSNDKEIILKVIDSGANDFINALAEPYEFVLRIINSIKLKYQKNVNDRDSQILKQLKVKDELTGLYNYDYAKQLIENVIDSELLKVGTFMIIAPNKKKKVSFSVEKFVKSTKDVIRTCDILVLWKGLSFGLFLPNTDINGSISVLNKIKENSNYDICTGISLIADKPFKQVENDAMNALSEAIATGSGFVYSDEEKDTTLDEWLDEAKGYKLFRQMFNKKLEKVITPVFYRLQKTYEEKLFNTEIEQFVTEEQCLFKLSGPKGISSLNIIYPGFSKIIISIKHDGFDSPENTELQLQLSKVTQKELINIIENFVKEYKSRN